MFDMSLLHRKGTICGHHTAAVHVGTPAYDFQEWVQTNVYFHGFADLPTERGEFVSSPFFYCLGYEWRIRLYPRGKETERATTGSMSIYLMSGSKTRNIHVEYEFAIKGCNDKSSITYKFNPSKILLTATEP